MNKLKRFIFTLILIIAPWFVFFIDGYFKNALIALFLQGTVIGWIPAVIWARRSCEALQEPHTQSTKSPHHQDHP